jgi:Mn2+/Fe2+ NRAMP family transporter
MRTDVRTGIGFSNLIFFFIILVGGTELHAKGITDVQTVEQAAQALRPFVGEGAYLLFAIGIIGTGLLAIPVLAGSISYMFSEAMGLEEGLNKKFHQAPGFYVVLTISILLALAINLAGINPVKALIYTAMLYGICSPVLIGIILHICNNKKVMGSFVNSRRSNIVGLITLVLMTAAAIALLLFTNL